MRSEERHGKGPDSRTGLRLYEVSDLFIRDNDMVGVTLFPSSLLLRLTVGRTFCVHWRNWLDNFLYGQRK